MAEHASPPIEPTRIRLANQTILAVFIAWFATACYALAYLASH